MAAAFSIVVSAPCAMGLAVLAQPVVFLLYGNSTGLAANLLILEVSFDPAPMNVDISMEFCDRNRTAEDSVKVTAAIALVVNIVVVVVLLFSRHLGFMHC